MLFNTPQFIFFFILVVIFYYAIPGRSKKIYMCIINFLYAFLIGGMQTVVPLAVFSVFIYISAIIIGKIKYKKIYIFFFCFIAIGIIFYGKYLNFIFESFSLIIHKEYVPVSVIGMVGVSYYIFSGISYIIDIYKGKDSPDRNLLDVIIWISLFSKIVAGPIERHCDFRTQILHLGKVSFDLERIKRGLLIVAFGYFQKIVIADRILIFVDTAYSNLSSYEGLTLLIVMLLYSLQIYMDFAGYSNIALGSAYVLGIKLTQNFRHPYFSDSITEFWRKWHISLSSWLRDYIYIPLGGNRKGKVRQYLNLLITFTVSGLWHGAAWHYIIWGMLHGILQIIEKIVNPRIEKLQLRRGSKIIITCLLVSVLWIFFRAPSLERALIFIERMCGSFNPWILSDGTLIEMGLDVLDWIVLGIALVIELLIEFRQINGISIYYELQNRPIIFRWVFYYLVIIILLVFGVYGTSYDANNFIYFQY